MEIKAKLRVLDNKHSNGVNYARFNDAEIGGDLNLSIPGRDGDIVIDSLINIHAIIKPGIGKYGQYLKVESLLESDAKGDK